ncbi:enoyl-CoA hydratase/isomerase family protein [Phenylobacterium aquaticum]|uniref:enoyl-CoA hydratase/isomerase family protein n=1 Tax=Phenylobacterium aquaticum TaxID=1763816 RepID=UPI0026EC62CF|nr:enoyl-CoA hydratase/isomerase family protein [Phenylobacterium aquaticum]
MSETLNKPAAATSDEVLYEVSEGIATLTLNRPERLNTISGPMLDQLTQLLLKANADPEVKVILLTGAGRAFCAGLDLVSATQGTGIGGQTQRVAVDLDLRNTPPTVLFALDKPSICALNGSAAGYGMDIALGCDMRVMAQGAKMAAAFVKRGIVPESGGTWYLPRMIGWAKASELIFTGRTLTAQESLELGLANHVVPDAEVAARARALAAEIAANAPLAVQSSKRLMRMGLQETFNDHVHHVFLQLMQLFRTEDFREGMTSFLEKRKADFKGR